MKLIITISLILMLLSGCARLNSIYRTPDFKDGESTLIDIKQRAIISSANPHYPTKLKVVRKEDGTYETQEIDLETFEPKYIICAEPSPDSLSAYASEIALSANVPEKVKAEFASAFQENAAFVGLRTQSIQLLRDTQYRLCESYRNGAIDGAEYGILTRRFQKYMVALLAIEQLTGTVKANPIAISTEGTAAASNAISLLLENIDALDEKILDKKAKIETNKGLIADKTKEKDAEGIAEDAKKALEAEIKLLGEENTRLTHSITTYEESKKAMNEGLKTAQATSVSGKGKVEIGNMTTYDFKGAEVSSVAANIEKITTHIIGSDDTLQLCIAHLKHSQNTDQLKALCSERIKAHTKAQTALIEAQIKLANKYTSQGETAKAEEVFKQLESINRALTVFPEY